MIINLQTPICSTGYGIAGFNFCKKLIELGEDVHLHPIGPIDEGMINEHFYESINKGIFEHKPEATLLKIWHQNQLNTRIGNGKYFAMPIFELDTFTDLEKAHLNIPDGLVVCSKWAQNIIKDQTNRSAIVVPLGIDPVIFNALDKLDQYDNEKPDYNFFTIGKLEYRKGHDFIVECFNKAFNKDDNVKLNLMIHNPFLSEDIVSNWFSAFKNTKLGQKINFYNPVRTHNEIAEFIKFNDCGLFLSRAEGWNLELLESMACGVPVIATNFSAHTEYCNNKNSFLVEIDKTELAYDKMGGKWFNGQGSWAQLNYEQEEQTIECMRKCYKDRPVNLEGIKTGQEFSWTNSVKKLLGDVYVD